MNASRLIPILLALAAAIPAGAQGGPCRPATDEPPPRRSATEVAHDSVRSVVRDTLLTGLWEAARGAGVAEPVGIVFVQRQNRRSGEARVWAFRSNVPDSVWATAVARRADLLVRLSERDALLNFRMDNKDFPRDPAVECMPAIMDPTRFARDLREITSRIAPELGSARNYTVHVKMLVTRDGEVAYAEVSRRSGRGEVDRAVMGLTQGLRFVPAELDGVRVDIWVEQPVSVYIRGAPRERTRPE